MAYKAWEGWLHLDGWAGRTKQEVRVIGETKKRYRIEAVSSAVRLAGRCRTLALGQSALVPKYAISRKGPQELLVGGRD